ncbi:helix-turn-helix domain-containing protein [Streptomyces sp. NBC_00006]|uniref:helix-turn-helix domain-containing protein n=1 Tax=unclassified Streptomyces TaxID=2593676 RepID=UPI00225A897F|nr:MULTISPECIES: helix-turn-helix domain-containing protein [unclassified Streptomyces]MCX5533575.1 helix-turn-helix domain-containing protein [Streptomyces sp. NBC_00006]
MNDRYLDVEQVAELFNTSVRFPRRLVEERRIEYVKLGRHVRFRESVVLAFLAANTVEPRRRLGVAA